jgi:hypothetical protein
MEPQYRVSSIEDKTLRPLVAAYRDIVPAKLQALDEARYSTLPQRVLGRRAFFLTKEEVVQLVDWKLSHGTFRPRLKQLVESNDATAIENVTRAAFAAYDPDDPTPASVQSAIKTLSTFKGIGPATASLLLSVAFRYDAPFFSDELFRWCLWEEGKGKGWDRPIKYSPKEYSELWVRFKELRSRIPVNVFEVEKVAYVLARRKKEEGKLEKSEDVVSEKRKRGDAIDTIEPDVIRDQVVVQSRKRKADDQIGDRDQRASKGGFIDGTTKKNEEKIKSVKKEKGDYATGTRSSSRLRAKKS